jgi:polyisoprenoid-binding protein YceI
MSAPASPPSVPASRRPHGHRNLLLVAIGIVAVVAVAAGGYGLWFILIGPSSPASVTAAFPAGADVAAPATLDGSWTVNTTLGSTDAGTSSFAGYRVQEQLVGVGGHTAVGRTTKISGSMTLTGSVVSNVQVTVDLTALKSDQDNRDNQLKRQAIETDTYPTATFKTTQPIDLGTLPADGKTVGVNASGDFTLHGVTRSVTIALQAARQGGIIAVAGSLAILFSDYSVQKPSSFSVLSVDDHGTMELHLLFTHA